MSLFMLFFYCAKFILKQSTYALWDCFFFSNFKTVILMRKTLNETIYFFKKKFLNKQKVWWAWRLIVCLTWIMNTIYCNTIIHYFFFVVDNFYLFIFDDYKFSRISKLISLKYKYKVEITKIKQKKGDLMTMTSNHT